MRSVYTNIAAVLLVIWYSLSVIGFDVHTCSGSGKTFIATVISGTACEDIHPEHDGAPCGCCCHKEAEEHSAAENISTKPCCSDDWQMIVLTGVRNSQQDDQNQMQESDSPYICTAQPEYIHSNIDIRGLRAFCKPDHGGIVSRDFQRAYGVWRI